MNAQETKVATSHSVKVQLIISWIWVGVPLVWGLVETFGKAAALFK